MRRLLLAIAAMWTASALLAVDSSSASTQEGHARLVERVLVEHAVPGFSALNDAASKLPEAVKIGCEPGGDTSRARDAFQKAGEALAAVDFYRFGPLAEKGRRERMAFWPDPRGVVARQVRLAIAAKDPALITPGAISQQSAALQGLPALEVLLSSMDARSSDDASGYACSLAVAIAQNIAALAAETFAAWSRDGGTRDEMLAAADMNNTYKTHGEAAAELLKSLLTGLQTVAELQLKPRLDNAKRATSGPYAKLGLQRQIYASATQSLRKLYDLMQLEDALAPEKAWIKNWAGGTWRAIAMSDGMGGGASGVSAKDAPKLTEVVSRIGGLRMLIGKEMSVAAGVTIGFNELDGD